MKKLLYWGIAIIFGIAAAISVFYSNYINNMYDLAQDGVSAGEYYKPLRMFTSFYSEESLVEANKEEEKCVSLVYPCVASSYITVTTGEGDTLSTSSYLAYDEAYAFCFYEFNGVDFNGTASGDNTINYSGLRLQNDATGSSYFYFFVYNDEVCPTLPTYTAGKKYDIQNPKDPESMIIQRNVVNGLNNLKYAEITIYEWMIDDYLDGAVTSFALVDGKGNDVFTKACDLKFEEDFFIDTNSKEFTQYYFEHVTDEDTTELSTKSNDFLDSYKALIDSGKTYGIGYTSSDLMSSSVIWKTVGIMALYVVVVILLYYFLFIRRRKPKTSTNQTVRPADYYKKNKITDESKVEPKKETKAISTKTEEKPVEAEEEETKVEEAEEAQAEETETTLEDETK